MIFCTVGMEQYPFDRFIKEIDDIAIQADEEIFIQLGNSNYIPQYCKWKNYISFEDMRQMIREARIIIGHAGAGTFLLCKSLGKIPIIVPRSKQLGEHVSNHQSELCRKLDAMHKVIAVYNEKDIIHKIEKYGDIVKAMNLKAPQEQLSVVEYLKQIV